jgi:hypothetical protein
MNQASRRHQPQVLKIRPKTRKRAAIQLRQELNPPECSQALRARC